MPSYKEVLDVIVDAFGAKAFLSVHFCQIDEARFLRQIGGTESKVLNFQFLPFRMERGVLDRFFRQERCFGGLQGRPGGPT
jgi:hypothetical protein